MASLIFFCLNQPLQHHRPDAKGRNQMASWSLTKNKQIKKPNMLDRNSHEPSQSEVFDESLKLRPPDRHQSFSPVGASYCECLDIQTEELDSDQLCIYVLEHRSHYEEASPQTSSLVSQGCKGQNLHLAGITTGLL